MDINDKTKITILPIGNKTVDCSDIIDWAKTWDWSVGETVARRLTKKEFTDWETAFAITVKEQYIGLCILEKKDSWGTDLPTTLTPFITVLYIDPKYRGQRLSETLLQVASDFTRTLGFDIVYLISNEKGFYEKFGFEQFAQTVTLAGTIESIYKKYT